MAVLIVSDFSIDFVIFKLKINHPNLYFTFLIFELQSLCSIDHNTCSGNLTH